MNTQQVAFHQQSNIAVVGTLPDFETCMAEHVSRGGPLGRDETPLLAARLAASRAADSTGLPQTVYRGEHSCGWWHTNSLARLLHNAEVFVTILPRRFFQ